MTERNTYFFSIIIPAYNYATVLSRALDSVLAQPEEDYEIVVVNDGSTDETDSVMQAYLSKNVKGNINYIKQRNRGPSAARNKGITESVGKFLIFLDADDALVENTLPKIKHFLQSKTTIKLLIGDHISCFPDGEKRRQCNARLGKTAMTRFEQYLRKKIAISNGATVMSRDIFVNIKYEDQLCQGEDIPVFSQCLALFHCALFKEPIAYIFKHTDSRRHQLSFSLGYVEELTSALFDATILPPCFFKYRRLFVVGRLLSLFRSYYVAKQFSMARRYYWQGFIVRPQSACKIRYLGKLLRCYWHKELKEKDS